MPILTPLRSLTTLFVLSILRTLYKRYKRKSLGIWDFCFWSLFWVLVLLVAYFPQQSDILASFLGVGRGVDALAFLGFVLLFYLIFRIYTKLEKLERTITEIVRKIAFDKYEKK